MSHQAGNAYQSREISPAIVSPTKSTRCSLEAKRDMIYNYGHDPPQDIFSLNRSSTKSVKWRTIFIQGAEQPEHPYIGERMLGACSAGWIEGIEQPASCSRAQVVLLLHSTTWNPSQKKHVNGLPSQYLDNCFFGWSNEFLFTLVKPFMIGQFVDITPRLPARLLHGPLHIPHGMV